MVALYVQMMRTGSMDILMACNGALARLVRITAGAAFAEPWSAVAIGAIAAPIMMASVVFVDQVPKIDAPVSAVSVPGTTDLWGLLAVGIFANSDGGPTAMEAQQRWRPNSDGGVEGRVVGEGLQIPS